MNSAEEGRRSSTFDEKKGTPTTTVEDVNTVGTTEVVDAETEARILWKLDRRLVPMISWIYLLNFMDRGENHLHTFISRPHQGTWYLPLKRAFLSFLRHDSSIFFAGCSLLTRTSLTVNIGNGRLYGEQAMTTVVRTS